MVRGEEGAKIQAWHLEISCSIMIELFVLTSNSIAQLSQLQAILLWITRAVSFTAP